MNNNISELRSLPKHAKKRLYAHGVYTIKHFAAIYCYSSNRKLLIEELQLSKKNEEHLQSELSKLVNVKYTLQGVPFSRGLLGLVDPTSHSNNSTLKSKKKKINAIDSDLPKSASIVNEMGPIFDQASRPTCVAAGFKSIREYFLKDKIQLSAQHLYYLCKKIDKSPRGPGTSLEAAIKSLKQIGMCTEEVWPYNRYPLDGNESQGPPPKNAEKNAEVFKILKSEFIPEGDINAILRFLAVGTDGTPLPVGIGVQVYETAWGNLYSRETGEISMPLPNDNMVGWHCIVICGYNIDPNYPGGGFVTFKNSWSQFSTEGSPRGDYPSGYGQLPFKYLTDLASHSYVVSSVVKNSNHNNLFKDVAVPQVTNLLLILFILTLNVMLFFYDSSLKLDKEKITFQESVQSTNTHNELSETFSKSHNFSYNRIAVYEYSLLRLKLVDSILINPQRLNLYD